MIVFATFAFADEQVSGSILIVETDPYYFSEGDLGLKFLKFFQLPLSPYLISGKITEQSTIQEISDAYNEAKQYVEQKAIDDENSIIQIPSNPLYSSEKAFYLESLPSKEKNWFYELASRYVNAGAKPEKFNVTVQIKDGKGDVLQNWNYRECEITEFTTYYDDNLLRYKFHGQWQSEIKDKSIFRCAGLSIAS